MHGAFPRTNCPRATTPLTDNRKWHHSCLSAMTSCHFALSIVVAITWRDTHHVALHAPLGPSLRKVRGRWKWRTWKWRTVEMSRHEIDGHENDGHENDGPSKCPRMKLTDMKMTDMKMQDSCLNRSDDTEHCRMHGIVSETSVISWYSYTCYFRCVLVLGYAFQLF